MGQRMSYVIGYVWDGPKNEFCDTYGTGQRMSYVKGYVWDGPKNDFCDTYGTGQIMTFVMGYVGDRPKNDFCDTYGTWDRPNNEFCVGTGHRLQQLMVGKIGGSFQIKNHSHRTTSGNS